MSVLIPVALTTKQWICVFTLPWKYLLCLCQESCYFSRLLTVARGCWLSPYYIQDPPLVASGSHSIMKYTTNAILLIDSNPLKMTFDSSFTLTGRDENGQDTNDLVG